VAGEIRVTPHTDFPWRFVGLKELYVRDHGRWEKRCLASSRLISGRPVVRFENVTTPEEAARLTNKEVAVPKNQLIALPDDTYYIFDLVGCEVQEENTNRIVGRVTDVEQCPANDVFVIRDVSGKTWRCPVVKQFVRTVDIKGGKITVLTSGLLGEGKA